MTHRPFLVAIAVTTLACTDQYLPPRQAPARAVPAVSIDPGPPVEGQGRIAFDVPDGPATVDEILAHDEFHGNYVHAVGESTHHVCDTPCVVNLPFGTYNLRFSLKDGTRHSEENVVVGARPSIYRYAPGSNNMPMGRIVGSALLFVGGIGTVAAGAGLYASGHSDAGTAFMITSAGLDLAGFLLFQSARRWKQHGAAEQWTPDDGGLYTVR